MSSLSTTELPDEAAESPALAPVTGPADQVDEWDGLERIVALGDLHGDYRGYLQALNSAELIDPQGNWTGGATHFVQIGDIPDRGPDSALIIRHLRQLEQQASAAGGYVHALIGNHELMNITGQLHYVHPGEYEALRSEQAESLRQAYRRELRRESAPAPIRSLYDLASRSRDRTQEVPLGFVEHRQHWQVSGEFGRWVASHNTVIRLNNLLFVHAGISPRYLGWSIRQINDQVRDELRGDSLPSDAVLEDYLGPLWYRGLSTDDEAVAPAFVDALLEAYRVDHVVVGHTPCCDTIMPRYDGKVLVIDSGISAFYGGPVTVLLAEGGTLYNLQRGERIALPHSHQQLLEYYRVIARLEPDSVTVRALLSQLEIRGGTPGQAPG